MQYPVAPPPRPDDDPATAARIAEAVSLHQRGSLSEAAQHYDAIIAKSPDHADALQLLALVEKQRGDHARALELMHHSLRIRPNQPNVWFNLGNTYADMGAFDGAYEAYKQAMVRDPKNPYIHFHFSAVCRRLRSYREAEAALRVVLHLQPDHAEAWRCLGITYKALGRNNAALRAYAKALELAPDNSLLHMNVATLFRCIGRGEEAEKAAMEAIRLQPNLAEAHHFLAQARRYVSSADQHIAQMESLLHKPETGEKDRILLRFALAKAYEQAGVASKSWKFLHEANEAKRKEHGQYDAKEAGRWFADTIMAYPKESIRSHEGESRMEDTPVFVVGMPCSGVTETAALLASHPQMHNAGELDELRMLVQRVWPRWYGGEYPAGARDLSASHKLQLSGEYLRLLEQYRPERPVRHVIDSMPGNYRFIGLIHTLLPNARILHCSRHPVAACADTYRRYFHAGHPYAYNLRELGAYYRDYQKLMAHWHRVLPEGVLMDVPYDALMETPQETLRGILDFCGVSWNDADLPSQAAGLGDVTTDAWKKDTEFLKPLLEALHYKDTSGALP